MTFAEFKAKYFVLADEEARRWLARQGSRKLGPLGYGSESPETIAAYKEVFERQTELLESVGLEHFWSGDGEDLTVEVLVWVEKLLMAVER